MTLQCLLGSVVLGIICPDSVIVFCSHFHLWEGGADEILCHDQQVELPQCIAGQKGEAPPLAPHSAPEGREPWVLRNFVEQAETPEPNDIRGSPFEDRSDILHEPRGMGKEKGKSRWREQLV